MHDESTSHWMRTPLEALIGLVEQVVPSMRGSVLLLHDDGVTLRHGAAPRLPEAYLRWIDGERIGPAAGSCGTAAFRRERVIVRDIATDPLWARYRDAAGKFGLAACWSTPIFDSEGHLLGTFATTDLVDCDEGLYRRFGVGPAEGAGSFDFFVSLIHSADRDRFVAAARRSASEGRDLDER